MSDIIKLLPDSVANQIAAGEVVQRPASVVKELVENAVDAGATSVQIVLKDAGRTLIQVVDDGKGMTETDARMAFERHSTSKIASADDLFALHTMGFRGEALASIAAVAQVELRTRASEEQLGTRLLISGSQVQSQEPVMCPIGSNFMIKNIFFNVPARRKFLKSNQVEMSNIVREFEKLALVNPHIEFALSNNDNVVYKLLPGNYKQRIAALWGRAIDQQLIPLTIDTSLVRINGFIGKPEGARKRNYQQFMSVNGRYMRHPYFHKAVISSYDQLIPDDVQPNYFLDFTVDPATIDVNIHPTKTEIKFENELPIWQILAAAVRESLGRFIAVPQIDFDTEGAPELPAYHEGLQVEKPSEGIDPNYNPFAASSSRQSSTQPRYMPPAAGTAHRQPAAPTNWEELYRNFEKGKLEGELQVTQSQMASSLLNGTDVPPVQQDLQGELLSVETAAMCIQYRNRYILSPIRSGLMIVDQHRAHVRVLFSKYIKQLEQQDIAAQSVMFPDILQLTPQQSALLAELLPEMERLGFNLSPLSGNDYSVNSVPAGLDHVNVKDMLLQVIEDVELGGKSVTAKVHEQLALSIAKKAAIPAGKKLQQAEMEKLLGDLLQLSQPNFTPDGKKIIATVTDEQIDKMF